MKIRKGDNVIVKTGKDRGKTGKVVKVLSQEEKVVVEGLNLVKKHVKPGRGKADAGIIEHPMPIHVSNVQIIDPKSGKGTRVGYKMEDGNKIRVAKKSGATL